MNSGEARTNSAFLVPDDWMAAAAEAAAAAGNALRQAPLSWRTVSSSEGKDIKLHADRAAEALVLRVLERTGLPVLSEEAGAGEGFASAEFAWVVDPLDGSFNYQRGSSVWGVAVGLLHQGNPVAGALFDGVDGTVTVGATDRPAMEGMRALRVSCTTSVDQACLMTGFPVSSDLSTGGVSRLVADVAEFKKIRMLGSAAASLLSVARGQFDAYYERGISLWDVAAGVAIVRAAGGDVQMRPWPSAHRFTVYAGNGLVRPSLLDSL